MQFAAPGFCTVLLHLVEKSPSERSDFCIRDNRSLLHPEPTSAHSATRFFEDLFNVDLTTRTTTGVGEDANVFEPHQVRDDLTGIAMHRGVDDSLFRHRKRLKRLCVQVADLAPGHQTSGPVRPR
jgi:hypothetical protein